MWSDWFGTNIVQWARFQTNPYRDNEVDEQGDVALLYDRIQSKIKDTGIKPTPTPMLAWSIGESGKWLQLIDRIVNDYPCFQRTFVAAVNHHCEDEVEV